MGPTTRFLRAAVTNLFHDGGMTHPETRRTVAIALMMVALGALIVWVRQPSTTSEAAATPIEPRRALVAAPPVAVPPEPAQVPKEAARAEAAPQPLEESVGTANSAIHFERAANNGAPAGRIDVNAKFAVGVWQPAERRLRVLLLEQAPQSGDTQKLVGALKSMDPRSPPVTPAGVIDLRFISTAEAWDRSDLESASLTATNVRGDSNTADVLGGLEWHGSLPAPHTQGAPSLIRLQLGAIGSSTSADKNTWKQEWNFHVVVPVVVIE